LPSCWRPRWRGAQFGKGDSLRRAPDKPQRYFHWTLVAVFAASFLAVAGLHLAPFHLEARRAGEFATAFSLLSILPFSVLIFLVYRHNFLQIGRQKNLLYAISATFLGLLYLSLVRRLSIRLETDLASRSDGFHPAVRAGDFHRALAKGAGAELRETAQKEMDVAHRLAAEIQQEARRGDVTQLAEFIESRLKEQFEFAEVGLRLWDPNSGKGGAAAGSQGIQGRLYDRAREPDHWDTWRRAARVGHFRRDESGAGIFCASNCRGAGFVPVDRGEAAAERELAERERLALVGQMAASISHNLKKSAGVDKDDSAGATGESGAAGVDPR